MQLLSFNSDAKTRKSNLRSSVFHTAILYLAPAKLSGHNVCPNATPGCKASCLFTAGQGAFGTVKAARTRKTHLFYDNREEFKQTLINDIKKFIVYNQKRGRKTAIRLNGTSDISWERIFPELFTMFPDVQFYDYTKNARRYLKYLDGDFPKNYHLTFSRSERNDGIVNEILQKNGTVAIVFDKVPEKYMGMNVQVGDDDDLRFLNFPGIIGLKAKGKAGKDTTGFVVRNVKSN